ncbi:serine/threonine-protein kinase [Nocardiopsis prasina]|uniref:serine/threonine-protein kinase n=1 Tax=Nocardiopsis prasina TaxID=2015 RepID=UPI00034AA112|nr:serine/threonine-protein kinase [Nocardiopsis prasina]
MEPLHTDDPRELGDFRLLRRVGEGGMGVVFLAVSAGDDLAAVKVIRPEYAGDREFRARFASEVDLARRVRGPYTARVLSADTDGPRPWLATEYVPGPSLHDAVRDSGPFPEDSLRALAAGLAEALAAIHGVGLIHRDLKPSNVLLSPRGPQVIDFGIARAADATQLTRTGQTLGTPAFMSPEQAVGAVVDSRSDLFSFGGLLLFTATGRQPFGTGNAPAQLYRVVNEEPDLTGVPDALRPLVTACLAKDPGDRPVLGTVLAGLAGTALPRGDDDPTEWLPEAVATRVLRTVADTRIVPTLAVTGELAAQEAPAVVPTVEASGEAPEAESAEESRESRAEDTDSAPDQPETPEPGPEPDEPGKGAAEATRRSVSGSAGAPASPAKAAEQVPSPEEPGSWGPWKVGTAAVIAVAVVALVVNSAEQSAPRDETVGSVQTSESSATPTPTPSRTPSEPTRQYSGFKDTVHLGGTGRFATLSSAGVNVFEADETRAVERLTNTDENFTFSYSRLATTPDGSFLASKAVKSANDGSAAIHVWGLEDSERHVVELPDAGDGGYFSLSPDGGTVYFGENGQSENSVTAYRVDDGEELYSVEVPEATGTGWQGSILDVGTSPDGDLLVAALDNGVAVWDAATGDPRPDVPELRRWSRELRDATEIRGGFVVSGTESGVALWDVRSEEGPTTFRLPEHIRSTNARVREVSVGDGGNLILASGHDAGRNSSFLVAWDAEGEVVAQGDSELEYVSLSAFPDDDSVLVTTFPLDGSGDRLTLLDGGLEPVEEFTVPTR